MPKHPSQKKQQYPFPRNRLVRVLLRGGIGLAARIFTRVERVGLANIPREGPLIVVVNHFNFLDAVMLIWSVPWQLEFLADFQMPNVPSVLKLFPALYKTYDVAQGTANFEALRASEAVLAQNGVLGIFPEGRVHPPPLRPALPGAAFLALRAGAPILPVGIFTDNDWDIFGTIKHQKRRLQVTCNFGEVFGPFSCENPRRPSREAIKMAGDRMMTEIARLLPPPLRPDFIKMHEEK